MHRGWRKCCNLSTNCILREIKKKRLSEICTFAKSHPWYSSHIQAEKIPIVDKNIEADLSDKLIFRLATLPQRILKCCFANYECIGHWFVHSNVYRLNHWANFRKQYGERLNATFLHSDVSDRTV